MHLYDTIKGEAARKYCQDMLKMDPAKFDLDAVNRIEVFGTDIRLPTFFWGKPTLSYLTTRFCAVSLR